MTQRNSGEPNEKCISLNNIKAMEQQDDRTSDNVNKVKQHVTAVTNDSSKCPETSTTTDAIIMQQGTWSRQQALMICKI
jgi:hypothetical protein